MKKFYAGLLFVFFVLNLQIVSGQVNIATLPTTITQNFNGLSSTAGETWTNNSQPAAIQPGWYSSFTALTIGTGTSATNGLYNFGATNGTDRALGGLSTGTISPQFGIRIKNTSTSAIGGFTISFTGEQWRQNVGAQTLVFEYYISSTAITSITPGAFTAVTAFDFVSPNVGTAGNLDGNLAANRTAKSGILNINVPAGSEVMFRWTKSFSNSHGLAIDDLSITANPAVATYSLTYDGNTNTSGTAPIDASSPYTAGSSATVLTQGSLLKTGFTFSGWNTAANGSGTTYAAGSTYTIPTSNTVLYAQWTAAAAPVLAISGTPTDHGTVCPGTSATSVVYTITNTGAAAAGITVVSNDPQFVVSALSSTTITGTGGTATYTVTFTPASAGAKSATITVASTTPGSNSPTSSLTGTGTTPIAGAVTTNAASLINNTVATLNGNLTTLAVCPATSEKGFVYALTSANANPSVGGPGVTKTIVGSPVTGPYNLALSALTPGTNYSYKAYIFDGTTYTYGAVVTFTTLQAADHLTFVSLPTSGNVAVNLATFTVEARRPDNTIDNNVTATITISKATGPGNLTGTLSVSAVAGVATFSAAQFDAAGTYTISANSPGLTLATSGNIVITLAPSVLYLHNFNDAPATHPYTTNPTSTTPAGILNAALSNSSWTNTAAAWTSFGGNGGTGSLSNSSISGSNPWTLTISVAPGSQMDVSSFNFWRQSSQTTNTWTLSVNGVNVGNGTIPSTGSAIGTTNVSTPITGLTGTVTFVLTFGGAVSGSMRLDDFTFSGYISAVTPALILSNTGTTPTGNIAQGATNVVLSAFNINSNVNTDFTSVTVSKTGSTTTADLSNLRVFYDANSNSIIDGAEASVSGAGIALANSMTFPISGQTAFIGTRRYLVVADVAAGATLLRTVTTSVATTADITTTVTNKSGTAIGNQQTINNITATSDYFRSNVASGDWTAASSWQSSHDNSFWFTATSAPTIAAANINIRTGNTINITTTVTLDKTTVNGVLQLLSDGGATTNGKLILNNGGTTDELTIATAGVFKIVAAKPTLDYLTMIDYNTVNGNINVLTGGIITVGDGAGAHTGLNFSLIGQEVTGIITWNDGAIFDWNSTGVESLSTNNATYFPSAISTIKPILRVSKTMGGTWGSVNPTVINGILEINAPNTLRSAGVKTLRDGIIGTSILTLDATLGTTTITSSTAVLGGASLTLIMNKTLQLTNGITVPLGANVLLSSSSTSNISKNAGNLTVNGTIDFTDRTISNASGAVIVNGTIKTASTTGLYNPGNIAGGSITLNDGSTIEYNGPTAQSITSTTVLGQSYYNLYFSGGSTKTPINALNVNTLGEVKISGAGTTLDATTYNVGLTTTNTTKFTMDDGLFILGTGGTQPNMNGVYNITGGIVRYITGGSAKTINNKAYQNIEVTGNNVGNSSGNITLNSGGTFIVRTGGIFTINDNTITGPTGTQTVTIESGALFQTGNNEGFHGFAATFTNNSSFHQNIENVVLASGSTVEYMKTADQNITNTVPYSNLVIAGSGVKTAPSGTIVVAGNLSKTTASIFANNTGTVQFTSSTGQNYTSVSPAMSFNNLLNNSTALGLNINDSLYVEGQLTLGANSKFNIADNKVVVLRSTLAKTANLAPVQSGALISYNSTGAFVVERYIPTGVRHAKSWQLLTAPTTGQTIKQSWMENASVPSGYGTIVTGTGAGFDITTVQPSMKYYDFITDSWKQVADPSSALITYKPGYLVFVRGDRSITNSSTAANQTNLRTKGQVNTGSKPFSFTHIGFELVGNPYPSPIDYDVISKSGIGTTFYVWDPSLYGAYGLGAYQTIAKNTSNVYLATPGNFTNTSGATPIYNTTSDYRNIQSGQAFFVFGTTTSNSLSFDELSKSAASTGALVNRGGIASRVYGNAQMLSSSLLAVNGSSLDMADGNRIFFDASNDNGLDANDAIKLTNSGENFGLSVGDKKVAVENRKPVTSGDTIHYTMSHLKAQPYQLMFAAENMNPSLHAVLVDRWMQTRTAVSLTDTSFVPVNVTADAASQAADRFVLVFDRAVAGPLPMHIIEVTATRNADRSIAVKWKVENEVNINKYEVERSADGRAFTSILTNPASAPSNGSAAYSKNDLSPLVSDNYYRIKAISNDGTVSYSEIVKVSNDQVAPAIAVYPNPVVNKKLQLRFTNQQPGKYQLTLSNKLGQQVYTGSVTLGSANSLETLQLPAKLAQGVYQLTINGTSAGNLQVIIQ